MSSQQPSDRELHYADILSVMGNCGYKHLDYDEGFATFVPDETVGMAPCDPVVFDLGRGTVYIDDFRKAAELAGLSVAAIDEGLAQLRY